MTLEDWRTLSIAKVSEEAERAAFERQQQLTKPPGSLGKLESLAIKLAAMQQDDFPSADNVHISIFAADHGVAKKGVSAFPQAVTSQMILNFAAGGAAISVLANQLDARFEIINLGTVVPVEHKAIISLIIAPETADLSETAAMTEVQLLKALSTGAASIDRAMAVGSDIFIAGEMGIGNTTSASALMAALLGLTAEEVVGAGTGVSGDALTHKVEVVKAALFVHQDHLSEPLEVLRRLGGFEIAAMCGAYLKAAEVGLTCVVDGFISTVAALVACELKPDVKQWLLFGHCSAETHHARMLEFLDVEPLLDMQMRLGEGSGAALSISMLRSACALHNQMATFADAGVSDGQ